MSMSQPVLFRMILLLIGLFAFGSRPATGYAQAPQPVAGLSEVQRAVVRIEAVGTFREPGGMQFNAAGSGSGFIVDPSGIAVTNNHVVTGAAILKVYVAGEDKPRSARVLGVSECSDLAVIDIEGQGFPYLEWYQGDIKVGLDVYTAGFPFGVSEYTLTRGIISQARADGETEWASVKAVLMHDATINPGNSGGPLVDPSGKVVGVNYRGSYRNLGNIPVPTGQFFAIARDEALPVIEELRTGVDIVSIGINGTAVSDENGEGLGIWVSSVKSGSPADRVGVKPGDVITALEGLRLGQNGNMSDYCDILRSHGPADVLRIEAVRFDTGEILEGRLNDALGKLEVVGQVQSSDEAEPAPAEYTAVVDQNNLLQVEIPVDWADIDGAIPDSWAGYDAVLMASPDLEAFNAGWSVPGLIFAVTSNRDVTVESMLDAFDYADYCTYDGRETYEDSLYSGQADIWLGCGAEAAANLLVLSAVPADNSYTVVLLVQVLGDKDVDALEHILNTFVASDTIGGGSTTQERRADDSLSPDVSPRLDDLRRRPFTAVQDDQNLLQVEVPVDWTDIDGALPEDVEWFDAFLMASPDLAAFSSSWSVPGLMFAASAKGGLTEEEMLDAINYADSCTYDHRETYEDSLYSGLADAWTNCGPEGGTQVRVFAVQPQGEAFLALLLVQTVTETDAETLQHILDTFIVSDQIAQGQSAPAPTPAAPPPTATPLPQPSGPGPVTLWGSSIQGSITPGGERWYFFNSNNETEATLIAFLENAEKVEMIVYLGRQIPTWPPNDPDRVPNVGVGSEQGNRDQNDKTKELVWQGPVEKQTMYYFRLINRGNNTVQYCIATRPDKYTCPY